MFSGRLKNGWDKYNIFPLVLNKHYHFVKNKFTLAN